jgi:hypothetical protein
MPTFSCFPSMHEDAGWVVAEAGSDGLPVVALGRGGPPPMGAAVVRHGTVSETVGGLAVQVRAAVPRGHSISDFSLQARSHQLKSTLQSPWSPVGRPMTSILE